MSLPKGKQAQTGIQTPYQPGPRLQNSRGPEEYIVRQTVVSASATYPGQQQQQPTQIRQTPMQPGPGQLVHDMSKQHYTQQPGMPGVAAQPPPQQQQQQSMQHVSQQQQQQAVAQTQMAYNPTVVRQQQQVQTRPQNAITVLTSAPSQGGASYYPQAQARQMQATRPMNPASAAPAQQPAQGYYTHQMFLTPQTHLSQVPQAPIMNYTQQQVAMQIRQYPSQYPSQGTQQMYLPPYSTVYYPNPMTVPQHGRLQPMQQIVPQQGAKKERKLIKIQDPKNEKEIDIDELAQADSRQTPPMSGSSSARGTPPSNTTPPPAPEPSDVPAQFAQQVAAVAAMGPVTVAPPTPIPPPQHIAAVISPEAPLPPAAPLAAAQSPPVTAALEHHRGAYVEDTPPPPARTIPVNVAPEEVAVLEAPPQTVTVTAAMDVTVETVADKIEPAAFGERNVEKEEVVEQVEEESQKKLAVAAAEEPQKKDVEAAECVAVPGLPIAVTTAEVTPPAPLLPLPHPHPPPSVVVLSDVAVSEKQVPLQQLQPRLQENGELAQQPQETEAAAKDSTKKPKKKKSRDLIKKGEAKEAGGEMDAFVSAKDEQPTVTHVPAAAATRHHAAVLPQPAPTPAAAPPAMAPAQVPHPPRNPEVSEEERKVAVKNEENAKVSKEMEQKQWNDAKKTEPAVIEPPTISITQPPQMMPTLHYKEDQWSPVNPDGKKQYDRSFLLAQQDKPLSIKKPEGLPNLEVIKDVCSKTMSVDRTPGYGPSRSIGPVADFTPGYLKSSARGIFQGRMSQPGRKQPEQKKISLSLNQDIKLHEAENAWKASYRNEKEVDSNTAETEALQKCVRSILNKLTPQNFDSLVGQVRSLVITDEERFSKVIDLIFEKAIGEPNFSTAYAKMCKELALMRVTAASNPEEAVHFRKLLINRCQKEFEKDKRDELMRDARRQKSKVDNEEKQKQLIEELEEAETKARRRSLGNIRFIGELFKLEMLTAKIMHECLNKLIGAGDEDSLECLCRLLTTIGKELESTKTPRSEPSAAQRMDNYFSVLGKIIDEKKTSSRVRFMLQDVCELRRRNWIPRRDENKPKTLDQIKKEAERDQQQQNFLIQQHAKKPMDDRDRDRRRRGGPASSMTYNDAGSGSWSTVGSSKQRVDISFKISKPNVNDDIQLGPSSASSWGRGSSGGVKSNVAQDNVRAPSIVTNRFSAFTEPSSDKKNARPPSTPSRGRGGAAYTSMPQRSGKHVTGSDEKEQAIAAARMVYNTDDNRDSRHSRESSVASEDLRPAAESALMGDPNMNEDELRRRCGSSIDEYLKHLEFQDVVQTVITICSATTISHFLNVAINRVLERSSSDRLRTGQLLHHLLKTKVVSVEQFTEELSAILGTMEDIIVDVPHAWDYLGEIVSQTMIDGTLSFKALTDTLKPLIKSGSAMTCITKVVVHLEKAATKAKVRDMWLNSRLNISDFVGEGKRIPSELESLVGNASSTAHSSAPRKLDVEYVSKELTRMLRSNMSNEDMFDWINNHVDGAHTTSPPFIRALVCAIGDSAILGKSANEYKLNEEVFTMRTKLILKYVDNNEKREVHVLYALQSVVTKLQHPNHLLHGMFQILCDKDIISDEGFQQWSGASNPQEVEGHRVAVISVKPFLDWLMHSSEATDAKESAAN